MFDRYSKGEPSPLMLALGLFIMAVIFGTMSFPIQNFFSTQLDTSVEDLDRVADAKSYAQLYFYNYVPTAATYSTYQNSYQMAKEGGGKTIEWSSSIYTDSGLPDYAYIPGGGCGSYEIIGEIRCELGENVTDDLQENYLSQVSEGRCGRPRYNLDIYFSQKNYSLSGGAFALSPIKANCSFPDGKVMYKANNSYLSLDFEVSGDRYLRMARESKRITKGLYQEWSSISDSYSGTETACGYKDYSTAEQEAVNDAEQAVRQAFNNAPQSSDISHVTVETFEILGPSDSFTEGETTEIFKGSDSQSYDALGDCGCDEDGDNCETEYEAKVNVTLEKTNVKLVLKDRFSKIPVDSGKRYMEFVVDNYTHYYQRD
ncbi:hypothetical protein GKQ38_05240 [Candidatus Nanohaloarchaea archaeon]|nr:hypothetical protein GKQ38_05240 [Candidatus Nanohaloarchaea archaeon]